ncbi:hypothetical protein DCC81_23135 [Chitinophaga parva]|uniref:Transporter n=1 Tax=Chitinophaga parva TaxID=2169414 RepID=A0A2T7BDW4_9BACT|nr:TolC family protein [Chitinophaga parva]PUZ23289.1 hypothetical protein DCC81_23135 [Chitinophaga parva]
MKTLYHLLLLVLLQLPSLAQTRTLNDYLQQATTNSPLLNDLQQQQASNRIDSLRLRAGYGLLVDGSSNNLYAPNIHGWGYDEVITNGALVNAVVTVRKNFTGKQNLNTQLRAITLQNQALDNNAVRTIQDLQRTITTQYITTYGDLEQLHFTEETARLLRQEASLLKRMTDSNIYRQTDYLAFLVTVQQQELSLQQQELQYRNDFATLNYLCGMVDTAAADLAPPQLEVAALPDAAHSAFFRQYQIDSLSLRNRHALVDYAYKPKLSAFVDGGYNSSLQLTPYKHFGSSVGLTVSVPIYDGHQRRMQHEQLDIAEKTRLGYQDFFTRQYNQQLAQLHQQLAGTQALLANINHQVKYAEGLVNINLKLLATGDARIPDLVIALDNYLTARNLLTQNTVSRLQLIAQINYWNK